MKIPILISVPHAGSETPPEVAANNLLTQQEIDEDGDVGAAEIYAIQDAVQAFVTTPVARAFVDLNRATDDRSTDGVVKTHTCWQVPIYRQPLEEALIQDLLNKYYHPYHQQLDEMTKGMVLAIDCHTMAAHGPPIGPDPGVERPPICLSNADGSCPESWLESVAECLRQEFGADAVSLNHPFRGGYIIRKHGGKFPWLQMEFSRAPFLSNAEKRDRFVNALASWHQSVYPKLRHES